MRVLTVLPAIPVPATAGLQLRMLQVLRLVREVGCRSTVLAFRAEDADAGIDALRDHCDEAIFGGRRVAYETFSVLERVRHRARFLGDAARRRQGSLYPFSLRYDLAGAEAAVVRAVTETRPDVVILPSILAHYVPAVRAAGAGVVVDCPDVLTDLTRAFMREYGRRRPARWPGLFANYVASRSQERRFLPLADELWCTSGPEAERLSAISKHPRIVVVPNALPARSRAQAAPVGEPVVGFIGSYSYAPNLDAAVTLVTGVLPRLRELVPAVELRLAGDGLPKDVEARLRAAPGAHVTGRVGDAEAFVAGCRVMCFPLRLRGGVPLKLVEALAAGRPVVTTPAMVAGLDLHSGSGVSVADSAGGLADRTAALLLDAGLASREGDAARRTFEERFSAEAVCAHVRSVSLLAGEVSG